MHAKYFCIYILFIYKMLKHAKYFGFFFGNAKENKQDQSMPKWKKIKLIPKWG
jgi:hypothetical protein